MINNNIKKTALRPITITVHEINQLIFWAEVALKKTKGGSYFPEVLETIKEIKNKINAHSQQ